MHKRTKELIDYGALCGFELVGRDGNDHFLLTHPNGAQVKVSGSPGDYRGDDNCRAEMRRKSGVTPPRPNAGKYRHRLGSGFSMRRAMQEKTPDLPGHYAVASPKSEPPQTAEYRRRVESDLASARADYVRDGYPYQRQEVLRLETALRALNEQVNQ